MYLETVKNMASLAKKKVEFLESSLLGYLTASALAGVYVGLGIVLIFILGGSIGAVPYRGLVMGVSFGIALTLVVFAGSELFTGNNMIMTLGVLNKEVKIIQLLKVWCCSWIGNLIGSLFLAYLVVNAGLGDAVVEFIGKVAAKKMNMPISNLFFKGILCNWLVCLALWTSARAKSDSAKCILIFWCLFAFIASGYEHSIANMTIFGLSLFSEHSELVTWGGFGYNMLWVTLGNIIGGGFFVGGLYHFASKNNKA